MGSQPLTATDIQRMEKEFYAKHHFSDSLLEPLLDRMLRIAQNSV